MLDRTRVLSHRIERSFSSHPTTKTSIRTAIKRTKSLLFSISKPTPFCASHPHVSPTAHATSQRVRMLVAYRSGYDQRFAFDPRYGHSRLAEFDTVRGQITDIKKDRVLVCSNHTLKTKVYRVEYTKDGHLIIVLCTRKPVCFICVRNEHVRSSSHLSTCQTELLSLYSQFVHVAAHA